MEEEVGWFDFGGLFGSDDSAAVNPVNDQEALGQGIVDQAIYDQSALDLADANDRAALGFEGAYDHATAGPAYDPTEADPYGFQEIMGRAIVQQSQAPHTLDDTPLNMVSAGDVGAWANAAAGVAKGVASVQNTNGTIGNTPRQIFSNKPGQGGGYVLTPNRTGATYAGTGAKTLATMSPVVLVGLVAVGAYLVLR